jgi:regulatory protein
LRKAEVEELIANLIENNYLNEERFAVQYAGGKFRMKHWGRKKIEYELLQKGVNKANIKLGLKIINDEDYLAAMEKLARKKWQELAGEHLLAKQSKTIAYLLHKGYEQSLITNIVKDLAAGRKA